MVDNNLARSRNEDPGFFADDDPLAELARIVGYDDRLVPKAPAASSRREPALNLEDELLQEFEQYDAPRPHQSMPGYDTAPVEEGIPPADTWVQERDETRFDASAQPQESAASFLPVEPYHEPAAVAGARFDAAGLLSGEDVIEDEPEIKSEFAPAPVVASEPVAAVSPEEDSVEVAEDATPEVVVSSPVFDLADEVELTVAAPAEADAVVSDVVAEAPKKSGAYTPGFRMPLANFNMSREPLSSTSRVLDEVQDKPVVAAPAPAESFDTAAVEDVVPPSDNEILAELDWADLEAAAQNGMSDLPVEPAPQPVAAFGAAAPSASSFSAIDDLISDIQRFPLPVSGPTMAVGVAAASPVIAAPAAAATPVPKESPAGSGSANLDNSDLFSDDPMIDEEFELALDDLELDLSDIMADEDYSRIAEPRPAATREAEPPAAPVFSAWPQYPSAPPLSAFMVDEQADDASASVTAKAAPVAVAGDDAAPVLPFDPSLITEGDEPPEVIAELDVPELPVEEPEQATSYQADYDFDLDGELATLLNDPVAAAPETGEAAVEEDEETAEPAHTSLAYTDLDEFERVLEEDFRRSLSAPLPARTGAAAVSAKSQKGSSWQSQRSMASFAAPVAIAGFVIAAGSLAYLLLGDTGSSVASNGEPIVIAADTDPVKVLPENPGGKTVPNQDKAVYDRVAGAAPQAPKQEALISTSEEPIDVVQRTLMTDSLPLEGEYNADMVDGAPVDGVEDRLMPDGNTAAADAGSQQPVAVMPRRVKTMIVRPDGTLVEQEVPVSAEPAATAAPATEIAKVPAASVKTVELAAIPDTPVASSGQSPQAAGIMPVSTDAGVTQALDAPAAAPSVSAPVPTARPAAQPVDVVAAVSDRGNVTAGGEATAAAAPQAPAPASQAAAVAPGGYLIQIASLPSQADAEKSYQNLSAKFASVIGGKGVDIKQAEIAGKGTFYRVRIPAGSKADAVALCEKYRVAGGSCLVAR